MHNTAGTMVVFGTSGWRGIIGEDFTILNVHKVVNGIIRMMKDEVFLNVNGYTSFKDVQEKGIILFRDNRFMGDIFIEAAKKELASAGIKIYDAGECPTGGICRN
jgi:phosphomannomutase